MPLGSRKEISKGKKKRRASCIFVCAANTAGLSSPGEMTGTNRGTIACHPLALLPLPPHCRPRAAAGSSSRKGGDPQRIGAADRTAIIRITNNCSSLLTKLVLCSSPSPPLADRADLIAPLPASRCHSAGCKRTHSRSAPPSPSRACSKGRWSTSRQRYTQRRAISGEERERRDPSSCRSMLRGLTRWVAAQGPASTPE